MTKARDGVEDLKTIDANLAAKAPLASPVFTGNVGVGATSPSTSLHLKDNSTSANTKLTVQRSALSYTGEYAASHCGTVTNNEFDIHTNNTMRMRINSSGNVLIGDSTADRSSKLVVSGNGSSDVASFMYNGNTGTFLQIDCAAPNGVVELKADARSGNYPPLTFKTGNAERMRIENNGFLLNNGMKTVIFSFNIGLSSTTNFDFTIPNDVNYFEIKAIIGYYPGIDYTASIHGLYAYRSDAGIVRVQNFNDSSSANSGSWAVSNPNNTTIRVRKNGGNSTSGARGFIEVKYREA